MSGEHFAIVLCAGFVAFWISLTVQIVNRDRVAIWIAVALAGLTTVIVGIFGYVVWRGIDC